MGVARTPAWSKERRRVVMTLSPDARHRNLDESLISFVAALGDGWFSTFYIMCSDFPDVLPTTWTELTKRGLLQDMNMNVEAYKFTPLGYVKALQVSGRSDDPDFRRKLGNICKVLKDSVKGRSEIAWVPFNTLVEQSGVSTEFAYNVLDADLIRHVLGRVGPVWEGEHLVKVPIDFGHDPL